MPQKTNLNISPYYDDFNKEDKFYRVLFKPGFPVQARELTSLQSSLQNQIESFGSHIFKDGSMVIPGNINFDNTYYSVRIKNTHLGIPVELYLEQLKGLRLKGEQSGIIFTIDSFELIGTEDDLSDFTLYVQYLQSGVDNTIGNLIDGEQLITESTFVYGNTAVNEGESVLTLVESNASAVGSAVGISSGTYFIRGTFVDVSTDKIVLEPYSNTPSYRVGLNIDEQLINAKNDDSLYDNARGFSNFAAPGADRLKITTTLAKKSLSDFNDTNFVELLRVDEGEIKKIITKSQYSLIKDYFAERTFDESGHYSVQKFDVQLKNSLNDGISNEGIFRSNEVTDQQNTPSDDLACVKISAGKAYVKGYDVELTGTRIIDVEKPRDKQKVDASLVPYQMGTILIVNNAFGIPAPNINDDSKFVELYDQRTNSNTAGTGEIIGQSRCYSFNVKDASYKNDKSEWELHLFDIQTFTKIIINSAVSNAQLPDTSYVRGLSSGATGYAIAAGGGSTTIKLTQVTGSFVSGEGIIINEDPELSRSIQSVTIFGIEDVKSVYQDTSNVSGYASDFVADTVLNRKIPTGFNVADKLNINAAGIATCAGKNFAATKIGTIVRYSLPGEVTERFNRVSSVSPDGQFINLASVPNITGVCNGALPTGSSVASTFAFGVPNIKLNENKGLYAPIGNRNISDIDLGSSDLIVGTNITGETVDGSGVLQFNLSQSGISSAFYEAFDAERYSVHYSDGSIEDLTSDQVVLNTTSQSVTISGLTANQTNVVVSTTLKKRDIKSKQKNYIRSQKIEILKTAVGVNTTASGMSKSTSYGLRVEDKEISLNVPDAARLLGVFESINTNAPILDRLTFPSGLNLDTTSILGEKILGKTSDAIAQITAQISSNELEIVYLTPTKFTIGEIVDFDESKISTILTQIEVGSFLDITNRYELDKGQREQFYDYSRIVRKQNFPPATRKLLVVYDAYTVPSNDVGDFYTVNSYPEERFGSDIPILENNLRASDTIDFRPRVSTYVGAESPFAFKNRTFDNGFNPSFIVKPNESSILGYSFYLPRIDKLILDVDGSASIIKGTSNLNPKEPPIIENSMEVATIELPAYLYDPDDAIIKVTDNVRYTMRDIGLLEDRIEVLEEVTSLSLLELDTKTLQVQDVDGLTRFKTGFFVDDFKNTDLLDRDDPDNKCAVDVANKELNVPLDFWSIQPEIAFDQSINIDSADFSDDLKLLDSNVRKTGDLITLDYTEVDFLEQPLASRVENVNPFNMISFFGKVKLTPRTDSWVRNIQIDGGERRITGGFDGSYIDTVKTSSKPDTHIRSRNVIFDTSGLRPVARFYPFFDSTSGIDIVPKLIEINMSNGIFERGETVDVFDSSGVNVCTFRLARPDHKKGNILKPKETFNANPYNTSVSLGKKYSASSTTLNVDINALGDEARGTFFGYIPTGTGVTLLGRSSGAQAEVTDVRLVADTFGDLSGSFFFRDPLASPPPPLRFRTGTSSFKLTSSSENAENLPGSVLISSGETTYRATGRVDTYTNTLVIVRRPPPPPDDCDPLSQSFTVDESGAFITSVDLFFGNKDPNEKLTVEIRTMELGTPTRQVVQDYARVVVHPDDINTSSNAEVPTNIKFPSPVYLEPNREYALVLLAPSTNLYEAWIAQMGEKTVNTQSLPDAESVLVTRQYIGGSLFKSQNGSIWTASQFEDLKFKLYKAQFTTTPGTAFFYNPKMEKNSALIRRLTPNAIKTLPRKLKVGITTTSHSAVVSHLTIGTQVSDSTSSTAIKGFIERVGAAASSLSVTGVGTGFDASQTYNNVPLFAITGNGSGATATIVTNAGGGVQSATISNNAGINIGGSGYAIGDVLGITTNNVTKGSNALISVGSTGGINTLYLNNVQGEEFTTGQSLGVLVGLNTISLANTTIVSSATYDDKFTGNVIEVNHYNHGMTANTNVVTISDVLPDTNPIKITDSLEVDDQVISIGNTTEFATYNGVPTSDGYVKINSEIIYYDSIGVNQLGIGTRGVDGTIVRSHNVDSLAFKYELNGVDLRQINTDHNMPTQQALSNAKDIDVYYLEISRGAQTTGDTQVSFKNEANLGGGNIFASQNYQFNQIIPNFNVFTPADSTSLNSQIRTVSGTSAGGGETPFIDQGFQNVTLNQPNRLDTPRLICSRVNETTRLTSLPQNRSFTIGVTFESTDPNLSPILDTFNGTMIYQRSRLNRPVLDYVKDGRSESASGDPHSAVYIGQRIDLKNPATSLKVIVGAYRDASADFRVLYQLFRSDGADTELSYDIMPGFDNLNDTDGDGFGDQVIDSSKNTGRPDAFVSGSAEGEFKDYQFTADNLEEFTGFKIKIVFSGTNEALAPRLKDLRVIALA